MLDSSGSNIYNCTGALKNIQIDTYIKIYSKARKKKKKPFLRKNVFVTRGGKILKSSYFTV